MNFASSAAKLLTNKYVLYFVVFLAVTNVLGYIMIGQFKTVIFFALTSLLTSYFSKNMIVILLFGLISTNLFVSGSIIKEGLENIKEKDKKDDKKKDDKKKDDKKDDKKKEKEQDDKKKEDKPSQKERDTTGARERDTTREKERDTTREKERDKTGSIETNEPLKAHEIISYTEGDEERLRDVDEQLKKGIDVLRAMDGDVTKTKQILENQTSAMENIKALVGDDIKDPNNPTMNSQVKSKNEPLGMSQTTTKSAQGFKNISGSFFF